MGENNPHLYSHIEFPVPPQSVERPAWTGSGFQVAEKHVPILTFDTGPVAWTSELTEVHEEAAGDDHYIDRASREHAVEQLSRWVDPANAKIMDIGCSSGFFLRMLLNRFPGHAVIGADCIRGPLEHLSQNLPQVPLLQFDIQRCPWSDHSFDALVLLNVLEHVQDDRGAIAQVYRILKPGGVAVIEVPAGPGLYDIYDRELQHFRRYRMKDLIEKLSEAGFEILDRSHLGFFLFPGFWIVKKRNRRYWNASLEVRRAVVRRNISSHSGSAFMHTIMRLESKLRNWIYIPFGIRCLVTCRRPRI
jgi:SAM-dependent methyltransferase